MKINILKYISAILGIIILIIIYLSVIGLETEKFNQQIRDKINKIDKNLDLDLKKIKLTLDPLNFRFNAKTVGATIFYSNRPLSLEYIKTQVSLNSLIKNKITSSNIQIATRSIQLKDLINFIRASYNRPELFILEKLVRKGHIILDLNLNLDKNGNIKNDYSVNGLLEDGKINLLNNNSFENINFEFDLKKDNYFFKDIKFFTEKINFTSEKLSLKKKNKSFLLEGVVENNNSSLSINVLRLLGINQKEINLENTNFKSKNQFSIEINNKFKFKKVNVNSDIIINEIKYKRPKLINNYFSEVNEFILLKDQNFNLDYSNDGFFIKGKGKIKIKENLDEIKYLIRKTDDNLVIKSDLFLTNLNLRNQKFVKSIFSSSKEKINLKNHKLNISYIDNQFSLSGTGKFKINQKFEDIKYSLKKENNKFDFNTDLILENTKFKISNINYEKKNGVKTFLKINGNYEHNNKFNFKNLELKENNNEIYIKNLSINNDKQIIKIDKAYFNYIDTENKKNKFDIIRTKNNNYKFIGTKLNVNRLISDLLDSEEEKDLKIFKNDSNIELKFDEVYIDEIYFVKNLKGRLTIRNNKVNDVDISASFRNKENIFFSIRHDDNGSKITKLNSYWAKPLVNRYKFIRGFDEGYLEFNSIKRNSISNSLLIIDNFKVKEIPVLAKLLALASLQGIADLLTGEGIRFTDFEMKFSNEKKLMLIEELYAIGPSISVLMDGYIEKDKLISLRGTLVPASTINRTIASIPLIGDLLVGKKVGEGVFGVSFKIKGPPKQLETSVNPVKTLTPRFITRTLEKIKKN